MKDILYQERTQFEENEVKNLIEQYILLDGEFKEVYRKIYDTDKIDDTTELNLDMVPKAITKYILDNVIEFMEYCNDRQVKMIDEIHKGFAKEVEFAQMKIERLSEDCDERKKYENEKVSYEQNINLGQTGYGIHVVVVKELIGPLKEYMDENSQKALPEIIANFNVACQMHGILEQNEEIQNWTPNEEQTLAELQKTFEKFQKLEKRITQKRDETRLLKNAYQAELNRRKLIN